MKKLCNVFTVFAIFLFFIFVISTEGYCQKVTEYKMPPKEIAEIVDAEPTPSVSISPDGEWLLIMYRQNLPSIEELAQPELRIAGHRINPKTNGPSRDYYYSYNKLAVKNISKGEQMFITGIPEGCKITNVSWSPNSKYITFTVTRKNGIELWVTDIEECKAKKLTEPVLNEAYYGSPYQWVSDSKTLICKFILENRGKAPEMPEVPKGPVIQENIGRVAPARTYQDLLENPYDEKLFEYYFTAQLAKVTLEGNIKLIGKKGILKSVSVSPDGNYILVETIHRPFSYIVPSYRFPYKVEILNIDGEVIKEVADLPLADEIPIAFDAVQAGPRYFSWRADKPADLFYTVAQDEGNPKKDVEIRDKVYLLSAPFKDEPSKLVSLKLRYSGIMWCNDNLALVKERWRKDRREKTYIIDPSNLDREPQLLFDISSEDSYNDPGDPIFTRNQYGRWVLITDDGENIFLEGNGASPEGSFPFLDKINLKTKEKERLWQCEAPYYERLVRLIDIDKNILIIRRESKKEPPNYFLRNINKDELTKITDFPHPTPQLKDVHKELIKYKRDDGITLTGTLYLPPGYSKDQGTLPFIIWAYPREYKSAKAAGQVRGSKYTFTRISSTSPLLWLTQDYGVLYGADMPVVGEGDEEPNNTFVQQLVANAKAAIDALIERGVADPEKIAIGGHSYGAFMTANLLAHSDLFAAGIARSGAYNRTLTPFGFQNEPRTLWEAPDIYFKMSPFMHAEKVNEPILLIHGEADNNSGTFPLQSKRFYHALKGHGATVRLVMLPHESHGYRARESVMHMLWETNRWLDKYVKNKN